MRKCIGNTTVEHMKRFACLYRLKHAMPWVKSRQSRRLKE